MAGFLVYINIVQHGAGFLCHPLPGDQVGVVLCNGDEDVVSLVDMGFAVGAGHQVQGFGGVPCIDDFLCTFGVEEFPHHFLGGVVGFGCGNGEDVGASVGVAVFMEHIVRHGVHHGQGPLGGGGVVEVDDLMAVHLCIEDGEIFSD